MKTMCFVSLWLFVILFHGNDAVYFRSKEMDPTPEVTKLVNRNITEILEVLDQCDGLKFDGKPTITPLRFAYRTDIRSYHSKKWTYVKVKITDSKSTVYTQLRYFKRNENKTVFSHIGKKHLRTADAAVCMGLYDCYIPANPPDCRVEKSS